MLWHETQIELSAHPDLGDLKIARNYGGKVAKALAYFSGKRRETLSHVGLHYFANIARALG